jgi:hypothetical protein
MATEGAIPDLPRLGLTAAYPDNAHPPRKNRVRVVQEDEGTSVSFRVSSVSDWVDLDVDPLPVGITASIYVTFEWLCPEWDDAKSQDLKCPDPPANPAHFTWAPYNLCLGPPSSAILVAYAMDTAYRETPRITLNVNV